jgi:hypothetical protein
VSWTVAYLIDAGSPRDIRHLPLATKKRWRIPNEQRDERAPASMKESERMWRGKFPSIVTRSLSGTYNCAGLIFAARRTFIDAEDVERILQDDGYARLKDSSEVVCGDLIVYRKEADGPVEHVGLILKPAMRGPLGSTPLVVLSQWGGDGEYMHAEDVVPEAYGSVRQYYSERAHP